MREIKFRAWDKKNEKMIYPSMTESPFLIALNGRLFDISQGVVVETSGRYILIQYTGLKDKNGKEIYEGDIVKTSLFGQSIGSISFHKGKFIMFFSRGMSPSTEMWGDLSNISMEVIGNIKESPELLEKS